MLFKDRHEAGKQLANEFIVTRLVSPIVLGIPRGGVPVAYELAKAFKAPLDVVVAKKVGAPRNKELGVGAVSENGVEVFDYNSIFSLKISSEKLKDTTARQRQVVGELVQNYRGSPLKDIRGMTAIIVDDGVATGMTAKAAIKAVRKSNPRKIILAVPVCSQLAFKDLTPLVDDLVYLAIPWDFGAVGTWYDEFKQVTDEEVMRLLFPQGSVERIQRMALNLGLFY